MASEKRLRIKTLAMVLAMVVCANAGDLLLKYGMAQIGAVELTAHGISQAFRLTVASTTIWLAINPMRKKIASQMVVLATVRRSEEHTSELQSRLHLVCRLLLEKKKRQR